MPPNVSHMIPSNGRGTVAEQRDDSSAASCAGGDRPDDVKVVQFADETVGRSVSGHPEYTPNNLEGVADRLIDCIVRGESGKPQPLISFTSPLGYSNIHDLYEGAGDLIGGPTRKPSVLQQCLGAWQAKEWRSESGSDVNLGNGYYLTEEPECSFHAERGVQYIKATITLRHNDGGETIIDVLEMAPPYDGRSLSSNNLLTCYQLARDTIANVEARQLTPSSTQWEKSPVLAQFASTLGIGRGPALLVLDKLASDLKIMSCAEIAQLDKSPWARGLFVERLVREVRKGLSCPNHFIHHEDMLTQVKAAAGGLVRQRLAELARSDELEKSGASPKASSGAFSVGGLDKGSEQPELVPATDSDTDDQSVFSRQGETVSPGLGGLEEMSLGPGDLIFNDSDVSSDGQAQLPSSSSSSELSGRLNADQTFEGMADVSISDLSSQGRSGWSTGSSGSSTNSAEESSEDENSGSSTGTPELTVPSVRPEPLGLPAADVNSKLSSAGLSVEQQKELAELEARIDAEERRPKSPPSRLSRPEQPQSLQTRKTKPSSYELVEKLGEKFEEILKKEPAKRSSSENTFLGKTALPRLFPVLSGRESDLDVRAAGYRFSVGNRILKQVQVEKNKRRIPF